MDSFYNLPRNVIEFWKKRRIAENAVVNGNMDPVVRLYVHLISLEDYDSDLSWHHGLSAVRSVPA